MRGGTPPPFAEGSSEGSMCEDAQPMCNVNMCETECERENVNVKQTLDDNIRWRTNSSG